MRTVYYSDELNDDFSKARIKQKKVPADYRYITKNPFRRLFDGVFYRFIGVPVAYLYQKVVFGEKIVNRKVLRPFRREGYFIYGNHTRMAGDAFSPAMIVYPKKSFIVANPDSVSIPVIRQCTRSLGCVPLPTSLKGHVNFHRAILEHSRRGHAVIIYPEAHIWPYYTKIRPFRDSSFMFPAETGKPVFTFTVTYQHRRCSRRPKTVIYVDGPFFPDPKRTVRENQVYLRDLAYETMQKRSENSTEERIRYEKKDSDT